MKGCQFALVATKNLTSGAEDAALKEAASPVAKGGKGWEILSQMAAGTRTLSCCQELALPPFCHRMKGCPFALVATRNMTSGAEDATHPL